MFFNKLSKEDQQLLQHYLDVFKNPDKYYFSNYPTPSFLYNQMYKALLIPCCREHIDEFIEIIQCMKEKEEKMDPPYYTGHYLLKDLLYLKEKGINKSKHKYIKIIDEGIKNLNPFCLYNVSDMFEYEDLALEYCYGAIYHKISNFKSPIHQYFFKDDEEYVKKIEILKERFDEMTRLAREGKI